MIERCRVELHELHVFHRSFGTVNHGDAVSGSYQRIGRCLVYGSYAAGCHQRHLGQIGIYLSGFRVENVSAVAFDVRCLAGNGYP